MPHPGAILTQQVDTHYCAPGSSVTMWITATVEDGSEVMSPATYPWHLGDWLRFTALNAYYQPAAPPHPVDLNPELPDYWNDTDAGKSTQTQSTGHDWQMYAGIQLPAPRFIEEVLNSVANPWFLLSVLLLSIASGCFLYRKYFRKEAVSMPRSHELDTWVNAPNYNHYGTFMEVSSINTDSNFVGERKIGSLALVDTTDLMA